MLGIQNQRYVHGFNMRFAGTLAVQQMQEMAADAVFFAVEADDFAVVAVVIPIQEHAAQRRH